jgi:hypothetical protein
MKFLPKYVFVFFLLITNSPITYCQQLLVKGSAYNCETRDAVENVNMQLIRTRYYTTGEIQRDTLTTVTDKSGQFKFSTENADRFILTCKDIRFRDDQISINIRDTVSIAYCLNPPAYTGYLPEFLFNINSLEPQDTSLYTAWDLNTYNNPSRKIQLVAYYAPGEKKAIAQKRATAILNGFVSRGANKKCFVIKNEVYPQLELHHKQIIFYKDREYFFKKGLLIDDCYISSLTGDQKEAALQLLRVVRLEWLSK